MRHLRSSTVLTGWLRSIAIEWGGRPAARLCRRLRLAAVRTRLLRPLTAPAVPDRAPQVPGVDEFAFRKGCTYGTVLVDVEAGRVVDVPPDRTSETFAAWLTEHPGAEIICPHRATAYTKAVKQAAPNALEVADRWHLLQNLSAAVEKICHQRPRCRSLRGCSARRPRGQRLQQACPELGTNERTSGARGGSRPQAPSPPGGAVPSG
ncbi:transposase [Streptomyces lydicus]|uniref:transposase n=1 Tax=Streptomyces lydicus TaxID=47763 RepID=UPI0036EBCDFE